MIDRLLGREKFPPRRKFTEIVVNPQGSFSLREIYISDNYNPNHKEIHICKKMITRGTSYY